MVDYETCIGLRYIVMLKCMCIVQIVRQQYMGEQLVEGTLKDTALFKPTAPREKWLKRRTTIKLKVSSLSNRNQVTCNSI